MLFAIRAKSEALSAGLLRSGLQAIGSPVARSTRWYSTFYKKLLQLPANILILTIK